MGSLLKFLSVVITLFLICPPSYAQQASEFHCNNNSHISDSQCQALVDFYNSTSGPNWHDNNTNHWLKTDNPCEWEGVTCWGNKVVRLEVPDNGLQGRLPDLGGLVYLMQLGVFNNPDLSGPLPDFTQFKDLTHLLLFNTSLTGFFPDVSHMPSLTNLVAHNSQFFGPVPDLSGLEYRVFFGNDLCVSPRINYAQMASEIEGMTTCQPMLMDRLQAKLNVTDYGAIANDGAYDNQAINRALTALANTLPPNTPLSNLTLYFPSGTYHVDESINIEHFSQINVLGEARGERAPKLIKSAAFGNNSNGRISHPENGAIFNIRFGDGLLFKNFKLEGQLKSLTEPYSWWDHGVYIASTFHTSVIDNEFQHFGDSAIGLNTSNEDTSSPINSAYHLVYGNYFYNITQTSTTSNQGGSSDYHFLNNVGEHIKGAFKFATRKQGASNLTIMNNKVRSAGVGNGISTNNGFEIEGYTNVKVINNELSDGEGLGIVIRSAQSRTSASAYDWGNVIVIGNTVSRYKQGIYISNLPHYSDHSLATATNILVSNNVVQDMWNGDLQAGIHFVGTQFQYCSAINNTVKGGLYGVWPDSPDATWLFKEGNTLEP